jgi:hypothetical protein
VQPLEHFAKFGNHRSFGHVLHTGILVYWRLVRQNRISSQPPGWLKQVCKLTLDPTPTSRAGCRLDDFQSPELTTVRDNLRHASVSTTSVYLHTDQAKRARQMRNAFGVPIA